MSGGPKKSAIDPTFPAKNPTIDRRPGANAIPLSQSSHYSESSAPPFGCNDSQTLAVESVLILVEEQSA